MLVGFRNFIMKGNVVDLAVGVVIGVAFGNVVSSLVANVVMPIIGAIGGTPDFSGLHFTINQSQFMIGNFLNALISFLMIAAVVYFAIVLPMNKLTETISSGNKKDPTEKTCSDCLSRISSKAKKCKFCTSAQK